MRREDLAGWVALRAVGCILTCLGMSVQDLSSSHCSCRESGFSNVKSPIEKKLGDGNILEWRSKQNDVMLLEIIRSDVAAGFDGGSHSHLPKKAGQHGDSLQLASTGVSILIVELARLSNQRRIRRKLSPAPE